MYGRTLCLALVALLLPAAPARADLLLPSASFAGHTQAEWSAIWWQHMLAIPNWQSFHAYRSRYHWFPHSHRFVNLDTGASADAERNDI